ncbi:MAG: DNA-methyltransferase, partial [Promethearchaeota archaeon]
MVKMISVNDIFCQDAREMIQLEDNSVDLMITSPPYNATKQYDEDLSLKEYLKLIEDVLKEVYRVLKPSGIAALNIANVGRKPYLPLDCFIIQIFLKIGYEINAELIWNKEASAGGSCAWGSWQSASNPSLRDVHEYIIIATKGDGGVSIPKEKIGEFPEKLEKRNLNIDLGEYFLDMWKFGTESAKRVNHPAPFPVELPYRVIMMFSKKGDLILDPFMGSGSVAIASLIAKRRYVGYEINQEYINNAKTRINNLLNPVKKSKKKKQKTPNKKSTLEYFKENKD